MYGIFNTLLSETSVNHSFGISMRSYTNSFHRHKLEDCVSSRKGSTENVQGYRREYNEKHGLVSNIIKM